MKILISLIAMIFGFICLVNPLFSQVTVHIDGNSEMHAEQADIMISGDFHFDGDCITQSSRLVFDGSEDQYIQQSAQRTLDHLEIDKQSGSLYLTDSLRIADSLSLTRGKIITAGGAPLLLLAAAESVGGDSVTFVEGPLLKVYPVSALPDSFTFAAGDEQDYRPLTVSFASVSGDSLIVSVEQFNNDAKMFGINYSGIDKISTIRYWHVAKSGPGNFSDARLTLSYDTLASDDGVEIGDELRIAQLDTSALWIWNNIGGQGSADYKGDITSTAFADFESGYFTFGDAAGGEDISLPVFLTLFELSEERGQVALNWKTASEINNQFWLVQRKEYNAADSTADRAQQTAAEEDFETIATLDGQGTTSMESAYALTDNEIAVGKEYAYRLVDVSVSGRRHFHDEQYILVGLPQSYKLFQNYPNPFNPSTTVLYDLPLNSAVRVDIFNILGQKVASLVNEKQPAGYYKLLWDGQNQRGANSASGMYILTIQARSAEEGNKKSFTKAKKMVLVR